MKKAVFFQQIKRKNKVITIYENSSRLINIITTLFFIRLAYKHKICINFSVEFSFFIHLNS